MLRLLPRAMQLRRYMTVLRDYDNSVRREQRNDRDALAFLGRAGELAVHRQYECKLCVSRRSLAHQIEVPELDNLVAPEFETYRLGHSKTVNVEDPATDTELRDVVYHRSSLESNRLEMHRKIFGTPCVPFSQLQPGMRQRLRKLGPLEQSTRGGQKNANIAAGKALERLDALAGNF